MNAVWLWIKEKQVGPCSIEDVWSLLGDRKAGREVLFWVPPETDWKPLSELPAVEARKRIQELRSSGTTQVKFLDSGTGADCKVCQRLSGKRFPIDQAPSIPPPDCTCDPWCRAVFVAAK